MRVFLSTLTRNCNQEVNQKLNRFVRNKLLPLKVLATEEELTAHQEADQTGILVVRFFVWKFELLKF